MKNPDRIVIHFAEIALKGRNRGDFEQRLRDNVAHRLKKLGLHWTVRRAHKYLFVEVADGDGQALARALDAIAHSSGVAWYAPARWLPGAQGGNGIEPDFGAIERNAVEVARESYRPGATFRLRVNRAWKPFPLTSDVLARDLGAAVIGQTDWDKVDLRRPDHVIHVDVHHDGVYVHGDRLPGLGGLPAGTSGRVLTLLSGGIDSPVAAYLMARRGCKVDFIHFSATSTQQREAATGKVAELARLVSCYTQHSRLWVVPFTPYELATLTDQTPYEVVLFRRFMARTAEALAGRIRAEALVTGDNLGQVASQTIENLV
ncbi:MAG: THUMP domain-containing protein, partial [Gammaproteobacteria bacterium]